MPSTYEQLSVKRETPAIWRVTFNNPPINLINMETLQELYQLTTELENSDEVKVAIFDSADPDFFLAHWDISSGGRPTRNPDRPASWIESSQRLAKVSVISIALIRGRARGMGSEIALGLDMRFASLERAILGQPELGAGLFPGGGGMERLPRLVGRARALEIVMGAEDFDAAAAERYGWVNRALPDAELDAFVNRLAQRIASFDKPALAEAKRAINQWGLPDPGDLKATQDAFLGSFAWPATQARGKVLAQLGIGQRSDLEMNFGERLPDVAKLAFGDCAT